jgi:hypothetical protein
VLEQGQGAGLRGHLLAGGRAGPLEARRLDSLPPMRVPSEWRPWSPLIRRDADAGRGNAPPLTERGRWRCRAKKPRGGCLEALA